MRWRYPAAPLLAALLCACVTVNVYFPAAAAQQAADQIIDSVTGQPGTAGAAAPARTEPNAGAGAGAAEPDQGTPPSESAAPAQGQAAPGRGPAGAPTGPPGAASESGRMAPSTPPTSLDARRAPRAAASWTEASASRATAWIDAALIPVIERLIPAAHAQGAANLNVSTPEIRAITASLRQRFPQLEPYFASGAIGMSASGLVAVRDLNSVPLTQRALVSRLVGAQNRDLSALYAEVASANGHPEWEPDIQRTFARRWVERGVRSGWYYQDAGGSWRRK